MVKNLLVILVDTYQNLLETYSLSAVKSKLFYKFIRFDRTLFIFA